MKQIKKMFIAVISVLLAVFTLTSLLAIFSSNKSYSNIKLTDNDIILKEYNSEELKQQQITLRAPIMNVTKRNIPRPNVNVMSDEFILQGQKVTFQSYPNNVKSIPESYQSTGLPEYYKYMLLRQIMLSSDNLVKKSADGSLTQSDVYKHPAADALFGAVEGTDNAVVKEITIDPTYRNMLTTGLYLPAGEMISVKVSGLKTGQSIALKLNMQDTLGYAAGTESNYYAINDERVKNGDLSSVTVSAQYARQHLRLPSIAMTFKFTENKEYKIASILGGVLHIDPQTSTTFTKLTVSGAVETPHYILGVTTEEYYDTYLRNAPGQIGVMDTENGQLVGPASSMRKSYELQKLASIWHSFFTINESFTGGPYNENNKIYFDTHVPAGAAVSLGNNTFACPSGWFNTCMDYHSLLRHGTWGVLHELGHGNGSAYGQVWGLNGAGDGEVRNNALIALAYIKLLDMGTYKGSGVEHGDVVHPYTNLKMTLGAANNTKYTDFNNYGYFEALSVYVNLMHSFGADNFYYLLYSYKTTPKYYDNKRVDFIYRTSKIYNYDFRWYFNTLAKANIDDSNFKEEDLAFLKSLQQYNPMASYYAGTVNGVKTGGDQIVTYGTDFEFKLKQNFASYTDYEFLGVDRPKYGSLVKSADNTGNDNGNYIYKSPSKFVAKDCFSFKVKVNGIITKFTIDIRFTFTQNTVSVYKNVKDNDIETMVNTYRNLSPDEIQTTDFSGIKDYQSTNELRKVNFKVKPVLTGNHTLYLNADDYAILYLKQDGELKNLLKISYYTEGKNCQIELKKGEIYEFELYNYNIRGTGNAVVQIKQPLGSTERIPSSMLLSNDLSNAQISEIPDYTEPDIFVISNKAKVHANSYTNNKKDWKVIDAPNHEKGSTYEATVTDKYGNQNTVIRNKTDWLIDGDNSTVYHSVWSVGTASPAPHIYTIDTGKIQDFNFYQITSLTTSNYAIKKYRLSISNTDTDKNFKTIVEGDLLQYSNGVATMNFPTVSGRYLKLEVYSTGGNNAVGMFSVISEINAGNKVQKQILYTPLSEYVYWTKNFSPTNKSNVPNNMLFSSNGNERLVFTFKGESFSLYGLGGKDYGSADIYIDGKLADTISAKSDDQIYNKLLYYKSGLENTKHTIEVITKERRNFAVSYIGLSYEGMLLKASNIYLERGLTISLVIFILLFAVALTFVILMYTSQKFRSLFGMNKKNDSSDKCSEQKTKKINQKKAKPVITPKTPTKTPTKK